MKRSIVSAAAAVLLALLFGSTTSAEAAKLHFGTSERLNHIVDVNSKGPNGEALYLGYKTSTHSFILPYSMTDDGYILGIRGQDRYYRLTPEQTRDLQARNALPDPLPAYEISGLDWFFGHLAWVVLAGIGASIGWSAYQGSQKKKAEAIVAQANEHVRAGRLDDAIEGYSSAIKTAPKLIDGYHNRALAYEQKGDYDKAIGDHTTVIRLAPKAADAFLMRASANQRKGDHDRAITDFTSVIRMEPAHALAFLGRSMSLREKGDFPAALADLDRLLEIAPQAAVGYVSRAEVHKAMGNADQAAADTARAVELEQQNAAQSAAT